MQSMANSVDGSNSIATGEKKADLVRPVFAEDLAPNVRAGFDSTCDYIKQSHDSLAVIAGLSTRIDALGDVVPHAQVQLPPLAQPHDILPRRHADVHARRHGTNAQAADEDLEDDGDYAPQR